MPKRQQITESFGAGGIAVIIVAVATHYGRPISIELAIAIVGSLSPVIAMAYGAVRRYRQKGKDEKLAREISYTDGEQKATIKSLRAGIRERDRVMKKAGITFIDGKIAGLINFLLSSSFNMP